MSKSLKQMDIVAAGISGRRRRAKPASKDFAADVFTDVVLTRDDLLAEPNKFIGRKIKVDPGLCRPWKDHDRSQGLINREAIDDLKSLIESEGQKHPGLGRFIQGAQSDGPIIELSFGSRRRLACEELETPFELVIEDLSDVEMAVEMIIENEHERLSVYERACSYVRLRDNKEVKSKKDLMRLFKVDDSTASKLATIAELPTDIVEGFVPLTSLAFTPAYELAKSWKNATDAQMDTARRIVQKAKVSSQPTSNLSAKLIKALTPVTKAKDRPEVRTFKRSGRIACTLTVDTTKRTSTLKMNKDFPKKVQDKILAIIEEWESNN